MPIEKSRAEYLQALLNQRKQLNANNSGMLNPSVSNDLEQQALTTTNFNNKTSVNDIPDERKYASSNTDNDNWFTSLINKVNGFLTNVTNSFIEGIGSAFEGIVDLGATAIGALGEATGWYESDPFDEFVEHNYAKDFADFNTDVIGGGLPGIVNMVRNTIEYGGEYWKDAFTDVSNVKNKYHTGMYSDYLTPNREVENGFEEFAMGVSQSIGMMLPSIVIPGAAGLTGVAAKGASLGIMGVGAAGKGSEEAINEGASASQALGYGLASGGIEVASELVVGKALGAVGLGTGKIMGVIGGKETVKIGSKAFIKELAKDMFEEGMEEVFSATLEPLTKTIYKGSEALEQYKSKDYWLGTNGHFNESVLGQFTSGAVTAGITGGAVKVVNKATVTNKVGNEGYKVVNKWQEILQNDAELQKAKKGTDEYNRLNENSAKLWAEFMELEDKFINNGNNSQIKNMAQILGNPNEYAKYITTDEETTNNDLKSYLKELQNNTNSYEKRTTRDFFTNIQNRYGTDYKLEFGEVKDNNYAYVDSKNKVIRINDSIVNEKGGALLAHEYFGHVLGDSLSSGTRSMLYNSIKNTEWYKKIEKDLVKAYQVNDTYYQNLNDTKSKNNYYQDEVIAKYLEEVFGNKDTADSIKHLKKVFSQPTLLDRVLSVFNKGRDKFNTPNIVKEYAKVINSTIDSLYSLNKNDSLLKALFKEKKGYKLSDSENKLKAQYKNLFDLVKENKSQPQVAYSKNLEKDLDDDRSWGQDRFDYTEEDGEDKLEFDVIDMIKAQITDYEFMSAEELTQEIKKQTHYRNYNYNPLKNIDDELIKDIIEENMNYSSFYDIKYSKNLDSEGNKLSVEQEKYFKDSTIRDENGNLLVVYHGTSKGGFGTFDNSNKKESVDFYGKNTVAFFTDRIKDGADRYGRSNNIINGKAVTEYQERKTTFLNNVEKLKQLNGDDFADYYNNVISNEFLKLIDNDYLEDKKVTSNIVKDGDKYTWVYAIGKSVSEQLQQEKNEAGGKYYRTYNESEIKKIILNNINDHIELYDEMSLRGIYEVYLNIENPLVIEVEDSEENKWYKFKPSFISDTLLNDEVQKDSDKTLATDGVVLWTLKNRTEYDGIIIKGVRDGTQQPTNVYVTLKSPNQIKATDNTNPTENPDIRYSKKIDNLKGKVNKDTNVSYKLTFGNGKDDYNVKRNKTANVTIEELVKRMEATTEKRWNSAENVKIEISVKNGNDVVDTITITDYKELKKYIKRLYKLQQESLNATTENSKPLNNQETAKETKNEIVTSNQTENSKDLFDVDLSQEKYEVGKEKTKSSPNTYKSIETTKDIIELLKTRIAGDGFNLSFPKTYRDFMNKTFAELNKVKDIDKTVDRIMNLLKETTVEYFDEEQNKYVKLGNLETVELVDPKEWNNLKKDVKRMIQYATETEAKSKETLQFEKTIDRLNDKVKEYGDRINNVRKINNKLTRIKKNVGNFFEFTDDEIGRSGLNTLYKPFLLKAGEKGYKVLELKEQINDVLEWYNPEVINTKYETLPYNDEIRSALEDLYESLGTPVEITTKTGQEKVLRGNLDVEQLEKINKILEMINTEIRNMTKDSIDNKTYATASFDTFMANRTEKGLLGNTIKKWKRGFAPSYTLIREMFGGDSAISRLITTDVQKATNDNIMYKGGYNDALNKKIKELDIKKNIFNKKININGYEMTYDQALYLYISLNTETNFNEIDKNGFEYGKDKDKLSGRIGVGEAQTYKDLLEDKLPSNLKKLADYLQTSINTEIKQDYIKWYEMRYGKFEGRNELGKIGEKSYWMLNRSYQFATSAEKIVKTPAGIFKNSISRVNSDNAILLGGALSSYTTYIDRLGTEIYLKPIYRKVFQILNTKVNGTTIYKELVRTGATDEKYLKKTLNDIIGVQDNGANNDLLSKMMSAFSVAKLSLNIGSMMKQFASIWTSNIPLRQSAKGILTRMFNSEAKTEFRKLVDEIGGLKYREGNNAVVTSNVGTLKGTTEKIADVGMFGIKKIDYFTIGTGVYSLMVIGQNQYGFKIGTQENIDFVKEHWSEFELSQIGSSALSKSALSRGDFGGLTRAIFSFMQGANRAAFGSMINKVALYKRNHNLSKAELKSNLDKYKQEVKDFESNSKYLDENGKFDEFKVTDENERNQYISLKSQLMKAQDKYNDYINYEIVNGKSKYGIPVQIASGLIAQGIFVALINELMKHIKGKKDWDEWDIAELGTNIGLAISVDWIPFVNVIENLIKGYDVQVPAIEIMNEMVDVINNAKSGNWRTAIRQLALLLGDSTGIPFQTLYDYIYGSIKPFNPRIAYEMNSVLYGSSIQSATTTLKKLVEKQDLSNTTEMIDLIMNKFKLNSDNTINKELAKLYMNGYTDVLPKNYMTEYTDDKGNKISLTAKQIETFRKSYDEATKSIKELMNVTDYQNMTDEEKSKVIKKIYDSYYAMAKAKLLKIKADTKLGNYLLYSTQNAKIGQISLAISKISTITDSKTKTRKELVFDYVNKLSGFSKAEKLLLLHLCNYSSLSNNSNILKAYLRNNGMTNENIKEFLG